MSNQIKLDQHSPHWVDEVISQVLEWQKKNELKQLHVDDMKTPSGRVHTGALRGVLIHDLIYKALKKKGSDVIYTYVFNDMDPMDGLPSYLDPKEYQQHMGKPMFQIPAPKLDKSGIDFSRVNDKEKQKYLQAKSFGEFYALDYIQAFSKLGATPKIVWSHQLYQSGQMDDIIRQALNSVDQLKQIYKKVADYELPDKWYPFQVICPKCGKVGTTLVTDWDGEKVKFECQENKVTWAKGCGYKGEISPFGGNGKFLWKVDWPGHWKAIGVNVEGAGKDHSSAGGSRDMANAICKNIFNITVPFDIPYEWILIRGAKMSSSKGVGTSARKFVKLFPNEIGRFLFTSSHYNKVIDFDPTTMSIPDLYDLYDHGARIYWKQEEGDLRLARSFELAQLNEVPDQYFLPRFRDIAIWMQHPELNLVDKFEEVKGEFLNDLELEELKKRKDYATIWVENHAPVEFQLTPTSEVPEKALDLTNEQLDFLKDVIDQVESRDDWESDELQQTLYDLAKQSIGPRAGFQTIYKAFIGKSHGPRAAWLLLDIGKEILNSRVQEIKQLKLKKDNKEYIFDTIKDTNIFYIDQSIKKKYPSVVIGIAVIRGIKVAKNDPQLDSEINNFIMKNSDLTNQMIDSSIEITSYRRLYREMGLNWFNRMSSPAALLRRVVSKNDMVRLNTCVDAYNLIVMKNRVSAGAFDLDKLSGVPRVKLAEGGEKIDIIGKAETVIINQGEICYFDNNGPYNLDYNYRDAIRTQIDFDTKNVLLNVDGIYQIGREKVEQSLKELINKIQEYCGGKLDYAGIIEAKGD